MIPRHYRGISVVAAAPVEGIPEPGGLPAAATMLKEACDALVLTWRCETCGWETTLPVPGFGGDGVQPLPGRGASVRATRRSPGREQPCAPGGDVTTKAQRSAELRDAAARSRLQYEEDKRARRLRLKLAPATETVDAFELVGDIAEYVTVVEEFAADADDAELSRAVAGLRSQTTRVGVLLARRRETYKDGARA